MKNIFYSLLLITQVFFAQNGFEKGNEYYAKGQYAEAVSAYESILNDKQHSSELYFNLGNAYYKLNKVAPAIYNYEKALVLDPKNNEAINNLKFAEKRTIDEIKVLPKVGFARLVRDFTGIYNYNTWAWISVGLAVGFLLFFIGYYFSQVSVSKRIFFFGMFVLFILVFVSMLAAFYEKSCFDSEKPAIVFAEKTDVKSEPRNGDKPIFSLHEGTKVFVFETIGSWKKIQLTDGTEGWIESNTIREVK